MENYLKEISWVCAVTKPGYQATNVPTRSIGTSRLIDGTKLTFPAEDHLSVEKALRNLFPREQHPKTPRVFGIADRA